MRVDILSREMFSLRLHLKILIRSLLSQILDLIRENFGLNHIKFRGRNFCIAISIENT